MTTHAIFRVTLILALLALAVGAVWAQGTPGADAQYFSSVRGCVGDFNADLPAITASAEVAAGHFVHDNWDFGAWGEGSFVSEFTGRAGGPMPIVNPVKPGTGDHKIIVLYCPREAQLPADWVALKAFHAHGDMVIAFTRPEILAQAQAAGVTFDAVVDNHAAPHGGMFPVTVKGETSWVVPTDPVANMIGEWTWIGEFVGACTRLGQMPTMWESFGVPGAMERDNLYRKLRFHAEKPIPVPAGQVGRDYLSGLRWSLDELDRQEAEHITTAGEEAHAAHAAGHMAYAGITGHSFIQLQGCPHDPGYLVKLLKDWALQRPDVTLQAGDFVLGLGYDAPFVGPAYGNLAEKARAAGATLVWSCTDYHPDLIAALPAHELFINQRWAIGDALVQLPGYDIRILPPSGVIGQTILWMIEAKYWELEQR
jgi:hypothetical protein